MSFSFHVVTLYPVRLALQHSNSVLFVELLLKGQSGHICHEDRQSSLKGQSGDNFNEDRVPIFRVVIKGNVRTFVMKIGSRTFLI